MVNGSLQIGCFPRLPRFLVGASSFDLKNYSERVKEALGESGMVSSETLAIGVRKTDALLEVSPEDLRHLFFEMMKELFYAIRSFEADDLTEADINEFMASADILSGTIHAIERRVSKRRQPTQAMAGFASKTGPEKQVKAVKDPVTGRITYSFG
jgi:hypothetical protein